MSPADVLVLALFAFRGSCGLVHKYDLVPLIDVRMKQIAQYAACVLLPFPLRLGRYGLVV